MDATILEDLGLTQAEIKVYTALLELGSSTAGAILERSGVQNSVLHRSLHALIKKGLISYVLDGRRRVYQAADPERFIGFIDEKKRRFQQILPELKERQRLAGEREDAMVFKGTRGIKEVYSRMIESGAKEYLTFGGGPRTAEVMGMPFWLNLHTRRVENGLPSRQVFDESVRELGKEIVERESTSVRFLPSDFASFQETVICGDLVAICVFADNPYALLIHDTQVAQSYRKHFEVLWESAKG